jgi:hypothetical protein
MSYFAMMASAVPSVKITARVATTLRIMPPGSALTALMVDY